MPEVVYRNFDFSGGLNQKLSNWLIAPNQATEIENITFSTVGAITKRLGSAKYNTTAIDTNPIHGLDRYYKQAGTKITLCTSGTDIYKGDDAAGTWTSIKAGLTSNLDFNFDTWKDLCFMTNGTEYVMKYDGTTVSNVTAAPLGKYIKQHKNRLFIAGNSTNPNRLYFSDLSDEGTWPANNFIDIRTNDGDWLTGLAVQGDTLVIFKNNSIFALYGSSPDEYVLKQMYAHRGTISQWSVVNWRNWLIFAAYDGVYLFDGNNIALISEPVENEYKLLNLVAGNKVAATVYKNEYWLAYPEGSNTYNTKLLVFDLLRKAWRPYTGLKCSVFSNWNGPGDNGRLYSGDSTNGYVWRQDTGTTDGGTAISTKYITKAYDLGLPELEKTFRRVYVFWETGDGQFSIEALVDGISKAQKTISGQPSNVGIWGTSNWGECVWAYTAERVERWDLADAHGYRMAFELSGDLKFKGFSLYVTTMEAR